MKTSQTSKEKKFIIKNGMAGLGVFASEDIQAGDVLFELSGSMVTQASRTSIQVGNGVHIENELGALVNHHCNANAKVDKSTKKMVSTRSIRKGEEITFNYNDNEDKLASPFICGCCGKLILGKQTSKVSEKSE